LGLVLSCLPARREVSSKTWVIHFSEDYRNDQGSSSLRRSMVLGWCCNLRWWRFAARCLEVVGGRSCRDIDLREVAYAKDAKTVELANGYSAFKGEF